ncbi:MAG TPA: sigma-70 family RNA polymerase sigma factor [Ilumatobacteraceae bacterium]|nr:sigma-70 family RNA polymerase sigma factor [Ilumatobacteraceae bacterium]
MDPAEVSAATDTALFGRARDGSVDAYGELVRRHQAAALRVAAVICGSTEEASDIVQEAAIKAHARLDTFRGTGSVRSWILRVVANEAKNHVRGRARRLRRDDRYARLQIVVDDGPDHAADRRMELQQLADALGGLPMTDREVIGYRFIIGLSEAETAATLGIPIGTVKSRSSRSLGRLAAAMNTSGVSDG